MLDVLYERVNDYRLVQPLSENHLGGAQIATPNPSYQNLLSWIKGEEGRGDAAFKAWADDSEREKWLANPDITIRKTTRNRTLLITWADKVSSLDVYFYPKGESVQVSLNHSKLSNSQSAEEMKKYWSQQLNKLADFLE